MWLTDFIPGGETPAQVVCKLSGTATRNAGNNLTTVPTPSCAQVGDYQIVFWYYFTNGTPLWDNTDWGPAPGQWKTASFLGGGERAIMTFRTITESNIGLPFTLRQDSSALTVAYVTVIVRDAIASVDPIPALVQSGNNAMISNGANRFMDHPGELPLTSLNDIVMAFMSDGSGLEVPAPNDANILDSGYAPPAGTQGVGYVAQRASDGELVNLNGEGVDPLTGWTLQRYAREAGSESIATTYFVRQLALGSGVRYGMYKDFTLTAGKRYVFTVDTANMGQAGTGINRSAPWFMVHPPSGDANQYGCCWNTQFSVFAQVSGTITPALGGSNWIQKHAGADGRGAWSANFVPNETGVHRIWFGQVTSGEVATWPASLLTHNGSGARFFAGNNISLIEVKNTANPNYEAAPYNGLAERLPATGLYSATNRKRLHGVYYPGSSNRGTSNVFAIVRSGAAKRKLTTVQLRAHPRIINAPNNGRTIAARFVGDYNLGGTFMRWADNIVGIWLGTKFYFEATITVPSTGICFGFGYAGRCPEYLTATFPALTNESTWLGGVASGRTYGTNGNTTGLAAWQAGDIIGCLMDYSNVNDVRVRFYRNGAYYGDCPLPSGKIWHQVASKLFITEMINGVLDTTGRFTLNTTGPFYSKPADALPYDFDNAVDGQLGDPAWHDTVLLLRGEGSNGSTTIVDRSSYGRAVTRNGGTQMDTSRMRNGRPSIRIGPTNDWLRVNDAPEFALGTQDFTFEGWFWWDSFPAGAGGLADAMQNFQNWPASSWEIYFQGGAGMTFSAWSASATGLSVQVNENPPTGQWVHIAVNRTGANINIYYNGVLKTSYNYGATNTINDGTEPLYIGGFQLYNQSNTMNGWISELRWTVGTGRYPSAFTPPSSDFPLA